MKKSELLADMVAGPLSNNPVSDKTTGTIAVQSLRKVVQYLNYGLTELYTRFDLREETLFLKTVAGLDRYVMSARHAVFAGQAANPDLTGPFYIMDSATSPFADDHIKTLSVYSSSGRELALNDENACLSLFTPSPNVLQIPDPEGDQILSVVYQARHPVLGFSQFDNLDEEIEIPEVLREALMSFVASRVYADVGTQDSTARSQELASRFEGACQNVEQFDLVGSSISSSRDCGFRKRGWV